MGVPGAQRVIALSKSQAKDADRIGGIELLVLWPEQLGIEPKDLPPDEQRDATPAQRQYAEDLVRATCEHHGLLPVHVRLACVRRPAALLESPGDYRVHLSITIIGYRWVHARDRRGPIIRFHGPKK